MTIGRPTLDQLRSTVARMERRDEPDGVPAMLPFGIPEIDDALPGGGLALAALHEVAGSAADTEHGAAPALFAAGVLARLAGPVLWVVARQDLFAPALANVGLDPGRVMLVEAGRSADVLMAMEDGLRHARDCGLAGVVGELGGRLGLTASRRLQLAAGQGGALAIVLRLAWRHDDPLLTEPSAAVTRWRIGSLPSAPPLPHAPEVPGLGRARWSVALTRCRGGEARSWIMEACDARGRMETCGAQDHLAAPALPAHRPAASGGLAPAGTTGDRAA